MFAELLGFVVGCLFLLPTHEIPLSLLGEESKEHESYGRLQIFIYYFGEKNLCRLVVEVCVVSEFW